MQYRQMLWALWELKVVDLFLHIVEWAQPTTYALSHLVSSQSKFTKRGFLLTYHFIS